MAKSTTQPINLKKNAKSTPFNPFPNDNLDSSKLKDFADDNFRFDENCRKFSKRIENTLGKGEIACDEQISPFPTVFSKDLYSRYVKTRAFWETVNRPR